jgi:hypothetical protein
MAPLSGAAELAELQVYVAKCPASDTVYDASTAGIVLFELPVGDKGIEVLGIGYRVITEFDGQPRWQIGPSSNVDEFCTLTGADLCSSSLNQGKVIWMYEQYNSSDFGSGSDMFFVNLTPEPGGGSAGQAEISIYFRPSMATIGLNRDL